MSKKIIFSAFILFFLLTQISFAASQVVIQKHIKILKFDKSIEKRSVAVMALWKIGKPAIIPLVKALNEKDMIAKCYVACTLGMLKYKRVVPLLINYLSYKDLKEKLKAIIITALGTVADKRSIDALAAFLIRDRTGLRLLAAFLLAAMKNEYAISLLIKIVRNKQHERFSRIHSATMLGRVRDNNVSKALIELLSDSDAVLRGEAAKGLAWVQGPGAINALTKTLKDKDSKVRYYAAESLGKIGGKIVFPALIDALRDKDENVRNIAAMFLEHINKDTLPLLIVALKDITICWKVAAILVAKVDKDMRASIFSALMQILKSTGNSDIKSVVIWALGKLGDRAAVTDIISELHYGNVKIKKYAIKALVNIGDKKAVPSLILMLKRDEPILKIYAANALGPFADLRAVPVLVQNIMHPDNGVKLAIIHALATIGDKRAIPALRRVLCDSTISNRVRNTATSTLNWLKRRY